MVMALNLELLNYTIIIMASPLSVVCGYALDGRMQTIQNTYVVQNTNQICIYKYFYEGWDGSPVYDGYGLGLVVVGSTHMGKTTTDKTKTKSSHKHTQPQTKQSCPIAW